MPTHTRTTAIAFPRPLIIAALAGMLLQIALVATVRAAPSDCAVPQAAGRAALVTLTTAGGQRAHGSGFVWDGRGRVVTNHHVAAAGWAPRITYGDGSQVAARVVAISPVEDLAVLEPVGGGYPVADDGSLASAPLMAAVTPGEPVVAYGNPGGRGLTRGEGAVRSVGRRVDSAGTILSDMIETSVPLEPGNSGGPLFDCAGRFVGINAAAVLTPHGTAAGFTIPARKVARVVATMLGGDPAQVVQASTDTRSVPPPRLGVSVTPVADGLVVVSVTPGQPGARAGLMVGDVLRAVSRHRLAQPADVGVALSSALAEGAPWLEVARGGQLMAMTLPLTSG